MLNAHIDLYNALIAQMNRCFPSFGFNIWADLLLQKEKKTIFPVRRAVLKGIILLAGPSVVIFPVKQPTCVSLNRTKLRPALNVDY